MRVAVIGAGIVGVCTAYELAADGHEVVVFERRGTVAAETSFANAGVLAPGYVTPWAAPGMRWKVFKQLFSRHAAIRFGGRLGTGALPHLPWLWSWWRACRRPVHEANRSAMQRLAHYSRERQQELTHRLNLDYEQAQGYLVLLRAERDVNRAAPGLKLLEHLGVVHQLVDADRVRQLEPALHPQTPLAGAIHLPADGVGNCRQFAHALKARAQQLGVQFRFDQSVRRIVPGALPVVELDAERGPQQTRLDPPAPFDAIVVCAGVQSTDLLSPLRVRLPLAPIWGYSVTAPIRHVDGEPLRGPRSALMDETYKVAISRLGQRVRVAGSAEIGGPATLHNGAALATLYKVLDDWFPGAAVMSQAQVWKGARPMLPDGPPLLGASGVPGIWLNLGHGSSGWALACGSARVLADQLQQRTPAVDLKGLTLERWTGRQATADPAQR
jgi:D-amino-acid dehydrogenase